MATAAGRETLLWDLTTGQAMARFRTHSSGRLTADMSSDSAYVLTVSDALRVFDVRADSDTRGRTLFRLPTSEMHPGTLAEARFSPHTGDLRFLSCDQSGDIRLWQHQPGSLPKSLQQLPAIADPPPAWAADFGILKFASRVAWQPHGQGFAALQQGRVKCWLSKTQQPEASVAALSLQELPLPMPDQLDCRFNDLT
ncbi:MAG: hypothetical protein ACKPHU_35085, partial [Planctomycetaceae bacterium]